jgi:hypothetical protein
MRCQVYSVPGEEPTLLSNQLPALSRHQTQLSTLGNSRDIPFCSGNRRVTLPSPFTSGTPCNATFEQLLDHSLARKLDS